MSIEVNGVTLPDPPSEVLESYPYAVIAISDINGEVDSALITATKDPCYITPRSQFSDVYEGNSFIVPDGTTDFVFYASDDLTSWGYDSEIAAASGTDAEFTVTSDGTVRLFIVWSNYDIYLTDADGNPTDTIYFARNDSDPNYYAPKSWYDGMAKQVMRLTGTSDKLTTDEMLEGIKGVELGGEELPNAEDAVFGIASAGYGLSMSGDSFSGASVTDYTAGNMFTAAIGFSIIGLRAVGGNSGYTKKLCLWDSSGNLLRSVETSIYTDTFGTWYEVYFDEPYTVAAGESFVVSVYSGYNYPWSSSTREVNGVVTFDRAYSISGDAFPTTKEGFSSRTYGADFIIGADSTESYPAYEVTRETMDSIATQVMRISGTTTQMTPAQIITALQGVTT